MAHKSDFRPNTPPSPSCLTQWLHKRCPDLQRNVDPRGLGRRGGDKGPRPRRRCRGGCGDPGRHDWRCHGGATTLRRGRRCCARGERELLLRPLARHRPLRMKTPADARRAGFRPTGGASSRQAGVLKTKPKRLRISTITGPPGNHEPMRHICPLRYRHRTAAWPGSSPPGGT